MRKIRLQFSGCLLPILLVSGQEAGENSDAALAAKVQQLASQGQEITWKTDPTLKTLGQEVLSLLGNRETDRFREAVGFSDEEINKLLSPGSTPEQIEEQIEDFHQVWQEVNERIAELFTLADKLKLPKNEDFFQFQDAKMGRSLVPPWGETVVGEEIEIRFKLSEAAIQELGESYQGEYALALQAIIRGDQGWKLVAGLSWQDFPNTILGAEATAQYWEEREEAYLRRHGTLMPGSKGPEFTFFSLTGEEHSSKELEGKVVVLEFWASWCGACQAPMAKMQTFVDKNPEWKDKVEVLALSLDNTINQASEHLEKKGWHSTRNVWGGEGAFGSNAPSVYKVRGIPTTYIMDAAGKIVEAGHPASMDIPGIVNELLAATTE